MRFIDTSFNRNVQNSVDEESQLEITSLGNDLSINFNGYRDAARLSLFQGVFAGNRAARSRIHNTKLRFKRII